MIHHECVAKTNKRTKRRTMFYIEILYTISATIAICACVPQVLQLFRSKHSDEFSIQTWLTWTLTQMMTFVYVASIGNLLLMVVNGIWVSFYACMTIMILRYRVKPVGVHGKSVIALQIHD